MVSLILFWLAVATLGLGSPLPADDSTVVSSELPEAPPAPVLNWIDDASVGEDFV